MSLLRPTIARQLLRPAASPAAVRYFTPAAARWAADDAEAPKQVINKVESAVAAPNASSTGVSANVRHNQPDFHAPVDRATSEYSPVPKTLQDGSDASGPLAAAVVSGAPIDLQARTVRIFKPSKPATQSGDWHSHHWRMDWDVLGKGHRWENELMGWQSSADQMQGTHLNFNSKEDAIAFAEKQGYEYFVQEPNVRSFRPKQYAMNFLHSPKKLKHIRTK